VNFKEKGEIKEKREKFLTAKYGHHQMSLIRKRLAVEMWLYEELKKLYESTNVSMFCAKRFKPCSLNTYQTFNFLSDGSLTLPSQNRLYGNTQKRLQIVI